MSDQMTIFELSNALAQKKISSVEITKRCLENIKKANPKLNCFITINEEQALQDASTADASIAKNENSILTGIPFAHKDIFCTKNIKTSCASLMLDNFIAPYDATVVTKMASAGMVSVGKLNMDEFAMGSSNEHSHYGAATNPWNKNVTPGGSSGGSAAAVAANLVPATTGTDTGGSIRQPASFCGVTGLKPTYGRVSRFGMIAFASSLDQAGPITKTAQDAAMVLQAMAGHDPKDSTSANEATPDYLATINDTIKNKTIGIPKQYFSEILDPEIAAAIEETIKVYENLGCKIKNISLPHTDLGVAAYYVIAPAECSANLARYDGVRYGYRCKDPKDLEDLYKRSRSEAFGEEVKRRIMLGTYVLSSGYYDAYYRKAQQIRRLVRDEFIKEFADVDFILTPTTPTCAYNLGQKQDPAKIYAGDIYTIPTNLAGLPGISIPIGFNKQQLPIGGQLIAPHFNEQMLLQAAHQYQQQTDWHLQHPQNILSDKE